MRIPTMILAGAMLLTGCKDSPTGVPEWIFRTFTLESIDGEQIPWQNETGTYSVISGSVTFYGDFRYERVRTIEGFFVQDIQTESGSFVVDGDRITMTHTRTGLSYQGTARKGKVTLAAGPSNAGTGGQQKHSYEYKR